MQKQKQSKSLTSCPDHEKLINQLLNQNAMIKDRYAQLLNEYEKLRQKYDKMAKEKDKQKEKGQDKEGKIGIQDIDRLNEQENNNQKMERDSRLAKAWDFQFTKQSVKQAQLSQISHIVGSNKQQHGKQSTISSKQSLTPTPEPPKLFRSSRSSSRSSSLSQKIFPLIQGCFILQKKSPSSSTPNKSLLPQMIQYFHPPQLLKTEKQALETLVKYIFTQPQIVKVYDDQFMSRKNQIVYGTPYEDFLFGFEDGKWIGKREIPQVLKLMGTVKKKYYHVLMRPEMIPLQEIQKKVDDPNSQQPLQLSESNVFYQTQVLYGFISPFPLHLFFRDLHRTIQQQLKYSQFVINMLSTPQPPSSSLPASQPSLSPQPRHKKYHLLSTIMTTLFQHNNTISKFPINFTYNTGISKLQISIPNVIAYREMEDEWVEEVLKRYGNAGIVRLLHYVLAERRVIIEVGGEKDLNQIMEVVRVLIRPFFWIFGIVYVYSSYFQPFMGSPMPILIGRAVEEETEEKKQKDSKDKEKDKSKLKQKKPSNEQLQDYSQFITVKMTSPSKQAQLKQSQAFYKPMKKLKKQLDKVSSMYEKYQKQKQKQKQKQGKQKQTKISIIHNYVQSLRTFIQKGVLNSEPTDFHIQFIQTQMVSYFKDTVDM